MQEQKIFRSAQGRDAILAVYDGLLQHWPVPYQTHMIPTRHGETFALTCGEPSAPPLVLLHGSMANSAMWIGDASPYSARFHTIALDLPGEPGKSQALRFALDRQAAAEWLEDVLSALGLDRVNLLSISLGGWVALKFAIAHPPRVQKLALLCPGGVAPAKSSFMLKALPYMFLGEWGAARMFSLMNGGQPIERETVRYSHLINTQFTPRPLGLPLFSDEELKRLSMPTLLLAGGRDPLLDMPATAARLQRLLPRLTVDFLPTAGHVLVNMAERILPFLTAED